MQYFDSPSAFKSIWLSVKSRPWQDDSKKLVLSLCLWPSSTRARERKRETTKLHLNPHAQRSIWTLAGKSESEEEELKSQMTRIVIIGTGVAKYWCFHRRCWWDRSAGVRCKDVWLSSGIPKHETSAQLHMLRVSTTQMTMKHRTDA